MIFRTGHEIADAIAHRLATDPLHVSEAYRASEFPFVMAYGILRGTQNVFNNSEHWFEIDRGFWGARHFDGNYRVSYKNTQPLYEDGFFDEHGVTFEPWRSEGYTLICPPTEPVCEFYGIDYTEWLLNAVKGEKRYKIRIKGVPDAIDWDCIGKMITFNSSLGLEAVRRGIPTISDPKSSVGSYTQKINAIDGYDREPLFSFISAHHFKLDDKDKIWGIINRYLSAGTPEKR